MFDNPPPPKKNAYFHKLRLTLHQQQPRTVRHYVFILISTYLLHDKTSAEERLKSIPISGKFFTIEFPRVYLYLCYVTNIEISSNKITKIMVLMRTVK